jgi:hypothetical protein
VLLDQLNMARKATAYGDEPFPDSLDAEDVATEIEGFIRAVATLLGGGSP